MPTQINGFTTANTADVDGLVFRAQKGTQRPTDYSTLGHYSLGVASGVMAAGLAANSEIFQFMGTTSSISVLVVQKVVISAAVSTTLFAAGVPLQFDMVKATPWSVQGTGGTGITLGATCKERTSTASSAIPAGNIRIATTTGLGAGTKTLEGNSLAALAAPGPITASNVRQVINPGTLLYQPNASDGHCPLVFANNGSAAEGFVIRATAVPATGTWTFAVQVYWAEVAAY